MSLAEESAKRTLDIYSIIELESQPPLLFSTLHEQSRDEQ
jgi:hypothetical protein